MPDVQVGSSAAGVKSILDEEPWIELLTNIHADVISKKRAKFLFSTYCLASNAETVLSSYATASSPQQTWLKLSAKLPFEEVRERRRQTR